MSFGVIFDLDQTLIDSSIAKSHRDSRTWAKVYPLIPQFVIYDGIADLLDLLVSKKIPIAIVTNSPDSYCSRVVAHHKYKIEKSICWHATEKHKPDPEPILKGIELLNVPANRVWSIGDDPKDIQATHAAGAHSVAAMWGASDRAGILAQNPKHICEKVKELHDLVVKLLSGR